MPGADGSVGASGMHITCRGSSGSHGERTAECRCDPGRIRRLAREDFTLRTTPSMTRATTCPEGKKNTGYPGCQRGTRNTNDPTNEKRACVARPTIQICSRRLEPALKPLFSPAVRTVTWNAVRGCGCRPRAARRTTSERLPGRHRPARALPSRSVGHGSERYEVESEALNHLMPTTPSTPAPSPTTAHPSPASRTQSPQGCAGTRRSVRSAPSHLHPSPHA